MTTNELSEEALQLTAGRFRLLAEPTRLRILHTLGDKEMSVSKLVTATGANQANVSKHLGVLLEGGIVTRRKDGLTANYRVTDETIFDLCDLVCTGLKDQLEKRKRALTNIF